MEKNDHKITIYDLREAIAKKHTRLTKNGTFIAMSAGRQVLVH